MKFWDLRQSGAPAGQAAPALDLARLCDASVPHISQKQHGITSLALHPQGKGRQPACHICAGACMSSNTCPTIQLSLLPLLTTRLGMCRQPAASEPDGGAPLCVRPAAPPHRPHPLVWRAHRWAVQGGQPGGLRIITAQFLPKPVVAGTEADARTRCRADRLLPPSSCSRLFLRQGGLEPRRDSHHQWIHGSQCLHLAGEAGLLAFESGARCGNALSKSAPAPLSAPNGFNPTDTHSFLLPTPASACRWTRPMAPAPMCCRGTRGR